MLTLTLTMATTLSLQVLRPGDEMLAISGPPYDTLEEVIGSRKGPRRPNTTKMMMMTR